MESGKVREEKDSIGSREIPADALYGVQTLRAVENFPMSGEKIHPEMIRSLALIKKACAMANMEAGVLNGEKAYAIIHACEEIARGEHQEAFVTDPIQGGAGTSMNMNANEVIANLAVMKLGGQPGDYSIVHPNDDVNMGQSTNDVIPTAGKMAALFLIRSLETELEALISSFRKKGEEFDDVIKMGRTQLQDAVPIRLGQEFHAYASAMERSLKRIRSMKRELHEINLGGTAIGTAVNADRNYFYRVADDLSLTAGVVFTQSRDLIDGTQNIDCFAAVSGVIKDCALTLSKICNDLRLMSSGPRTGLGEIVLPAMQNGSSIMPGKINPVIPEVVTQAAFRIAGNDTTICMAVESGQLELNAFEPVVFYSLFQSIELLDHACSTLRRNCIDGIRADRERCQKLLDESVGTVTALAPYIGYAKSASLAKQALKEHCSVSSIVLEKHYLSEEELKSILDPYRMTSLSDSEEIQNRL